MLQNGYYGCLVTLEDLTLYVVNQAKEIDPQKKAIDQKDTEIVMLKSQNSNLDTRLSALEQLLRKEIHK